MQPRCAIVLLVLAGFSLNGTAQTQPRVFFNSTRDDEKQPPIGKKTDKLSEQKKGDAPTEKNADKTAEDKKEEPAVSPSPTYRIADANPIVGPPPLVCEEPNIEDDPESILPIFGVRVEFLSWRIGRASIGSNLAVSRTTGAVLLGNTDIDLGVFSGTRVSGTLWLDRNRVFGLDASGFVLEQRSAYRGAFSDELGLPQIERPLVNATTGQPFFVPVSIPSQLTGKVELSTASRLSSGELNVVLRLWERDDTRLRIEGIGGFRYGDLRESLLIEQQSRFNAATTTGLVFDLGELGRLSNGGAFSITDQIKVYNQFYGGQLGLRAQWQSRWTFVSISGRSGVGTNRQTIRIGGTTVAMASTPAAATANANGTVPTTVVRAGDLGGLQVNEGLYSYATNSGSRTRDFTSTLSELNLTLGFNVTPHARIFGGYSGLYWTNVARPGLQIDTTVTPSQQAINSRVDRTAAADRPVVPFQQSDFWSHGWNVGFEWQY